ncbi:MAG: 4Fe-4S binding protein [Candidatus Hermodarchaeota archaeon]
MTNESIIVKLNLKNCIGCGICVEICPKYAIPHSLIGFNSALAKINVDKCDGCGKCVEICPHRAIRFLNHKFQ